MECAVSVNSEAVRKSLFGLIWQCAYEWFCLCDVIATKQSIYWCKLALDDVMIQAEWGENGEQMVSFLSVSIAMMSRDHICWWQRGTGRIYSWEDISQIKSWAWDCLWSARDRCLSFNDVISVVNSKKDSGFDSLYLEMLFHHILPVDTKSVMPQLGQGQKQTALKACALFLCQTWL